MKIRSIFRFFKAVLLISCFMSPLTGCGVLAVSGMYLAQKSDSRDRAKSAREYTKIKLEHISELKRKNNPLGDYLYAMGNADGWIEDAKTNEQRVALFEKAITNGSSDAKITLGYYYFSGRSIANNVPDLTYEEVVSLRDRGASLLDDGMGENCSVLARYGGGDRQICYTRYPAADDMAFLFKRGEMQKNHLGEYQVVVPKNLEIYEKWVSKGKICADWMKENIVDQCFRY